MKKRRATIESENNKNKKNGGSKAKTQMFFTDHGINHEDVIGGGMTPNNINKTAMEIMAPMTSITTSGVRPSNNYERPKTGVYTRKISEGRRATENNYINSREFMCNSSAIVTNQNTIEKVNRRS